MNDPILTRYRDDILRIAGEFGATNVRVFGSRARGEAGLESDIDLVVELEDDRSLFDLIGFQLAVQDLTELEVDAFTPMSLSRYIRDEILAEAVAL